MLTESGTISPFAEAKAPAGPQPNPGATVGRFGYDSDVPWGGATKLNPGGDYPDGRLPFMASLYNAYVGCPWLSAPIDAIARTITAGGVRIDPKVDADTDAKAGTRGKKPPTAVQDLQHLLDFCNPHMDFIQLSRGVATDLGIYGDSFLEVVWLLGRPVALYPLDPATMTVDADEHGTVTGYDQQIDEREVHFEPAQIIHISMDAPKGSLYGMGIAQKALLPVTVWLFTAAAIKETMRKGDPPHIHMDFPLEVQPDEVRAWRGQYATRNLGTQNIGNPITTRGGVTLNELGLGKLAEYLSIQDQARDTILSVAGVPPSKVGVIESGNLGGGTGTSQDKTFRVNTCGPIASIILEKLNFHLTREAFGVEDWEIRFVDIDWRDDEVVEQIRDMRLRNGSWTLNDYLVDIDKPPAGPEGDVHVLVDRQNIVLWSQMAELSQAKIDSLNKPAAPPPAPPGHEPGKEPAAGEQPNDGTAPKDDAPPAPGAAPAGKDPKDAPAAKGAAAGKTKETSPWRRRVLETYRRRLLEEDEAA